MSSPTLTKQNVVYLYDANPVDVRDRRGLLESQLRGAGVLDLWSVRATASRNTLLVSIDRDAELRPRQQSVVLLDLRGETGDLEQLGFKVCETIVQHPSLARVARPVIWTDVHSIANLRFAQSVRATAVIDDEWVDEGGGGPLVQVLDWACTLPTPNARSPTATRVFSNGGNSLAEEVKERNERFKRWFGFAPRDIHFALLWGLAESVEIQFLLDYLVSEELVPSERAARRQLERLQKEMSSQVEALDAPETARAEIARRFLAEISPPEPSPFAELSWPRPERIIQILDEGRTKHLQIGAWAYLAPSDEELLHRFLNVYRLPHAGPGLRARARDQAIKDAVEHAVEATGQAAAAQRLRLATQAIEDAYCDWRDHDIPRPLS